jgi:flavin reductase (DIM6/NTAB) family NADH-FMN oxidoreductase RutF
MNQLKHLSVNEIQDFERFYRANLINAITGYKPANLIGTYSEDGLANLAVFTSVVHLGANPPLIGFIQRPVGELSHTYKNIISQGYYTINHIHEDFIENAHYTSAKFDGQTSEFEACKLTEEKLEQFNAPFVKESRIKIGMRFVQEIPIELNNTILMIGQIEHVFVDEKIILDDGNLDLSSVRDVCTSGLYTYNKVQKIKTFPYAKVQNIPDF